MLANRIIMALIVLVGVPLATIGYVALVERLVKIFPPKTRDLVRPWLWVGPAVVLLGLYLIYPTVNTFVLSFMNADSTEFVGLANYLYVFSDNQVLSTLWNNLLWLVFLTGLTVTIGLLLAVIFDRVRYEAVAKALIFLPMAVSFVAASVIWKFMMYAYQPPGRPQIGTFNGVWTLLGGDPVAWLIQRPFINDMALILVGVWVWTGFALVILSAGLKGIPRETIEAAKVDGAGELQVFRYVTLPMMSSTIAVVATP
ncbi:MAG TPA: sugar ABC transporter permease, partial [Trueperaceae bacterium]